jgi:restriction system protein
MGRRRQSPAEDFMDLVALMPWWAGVGLALVSYLVLHRMAAPPVLPRGVVPGPDFMVGALISGLATAGQYVVPLFCCLGALASVFRRKHRTSLLEKATGSAPQAAVAEMSWQEFELLVGEAYRRQGFTVAELGGSGPDGGVDLVLRRGSEKFFVQCKHWKSFSVGVAVVRELYGVMSARGATGGAVVTGGTFTAEARAFASECKVQLVDGSTLAGMLKQAKAMRSGGSAEAAARERAAVRAAAPQAPKAEAVPSCPTCQSDMVRRTAGKGPKAGSQFWGCSRYPACRGTR